MLYLKDNVTEEQLKKHGFKRCKKPYNMLFYRCTSIDHKCIIIGQLIKYKGFMLIGKRIFIERWDEDDTRLHKKSNCKYRSNESSLDVIYDMITRGLLEKRTDCN